MLGGQHPLDFAAHGVSNEAWQAAPWTMLPVAVTSMHAECQLLLDHGHEQSAQEDGSGLDSDISELAGHTEHALQAGLELVFQAEDSPVVAAGGCRTLWAAILPCATSSKLDMGNCSPLLHSQSGSHFCTSQATTISPSCLVQAALAET